MKKGLIWILTILFISGIFGIEAYAQEKRTFTDKAEFEKAQKEQERITNAKKLLNDGNKLIRQNNPEEAIVKYNQSIELEPNSAKAYYGLGLAYKKLNQIAKAEASFREAMRIDHDYYRPYLALGNMYRDLGKYGDAINTYSSGIQVNSENDDFYTQMGFVNYKKGNTTEAIKNYNKAISIKNDDPLVYRYLAQAYLDTRNYNGAIDAANNAIKFTKTRYKKKNDKPYWIIGESYLKLKQYTNAIDAYNKCIGVTKQAFFRGAAYFGMGEAYKLAGNKIKAKENYRLATRSSAWRQKAEYEIKNL